MGKDRIGIIGVGRLGLAYALSFEKAGFTVVASSYKKEYIDDLKQRHTCSLEPGIKDQLAQSRNLEFTYHNHDVIDKCDFIYVMVATPSTSHGDYDVSAIEDVADDFLSYTGFLQDKVLIIGSTVNPGTTEAIQKKLQYQPMAVVYCPTFVAQGTVLHDIFDPHTLSIGTQDEQVFQRCRDVFEKIISKDTPIYRMLPRTAEILKLAGNCKTTLDISYFNMIGQILLDQGLQDDVKVADAYLNFIKSEARFRFGFGFGGPCYPRDNRAFTHFAKKNQTKYPIGDLVDKFNKDHVEFLSAYLMISNKHNKPFYFDYVSYKKGVAIFEDSQQLAVAEALLHKGHAVIIRQDAYLDPTIMINLQKKHSNNVQFLNEQQLSAGGIDVFDVMTCLLGD